MNKLSLNLLLILTGLTFSAFKFQKLSEKVIKKEELLIEHLKKNGYYPRINRISAKRSKTLNKLLPLSSKSSYHLKGQAIDIWVGDINDDGQKNGKDVDIIVNQLIQIHKTNPDLIGGIGTYKKHWYSKQMVHFDVRGYEARWNK